MIPPGSRTQGNVLIPATAQFPTPIWFKPKTICVYFHLFHTLKVLRQYLIPYTVFVIRLEILASCEMLKSD